MSGKALDAEVDSLLTFRAEGVRIAIGLPAGTIESSVEASGTEASLSSS